MEFNSKICTSVEESKRLLELGLKKETADMCLEYSAGKYYPKTHRIYNILNIPAWSLHRLMEIAYKGDILGYVALNCHERNITTYYERVIKVIEYLVNIKQFNPEYLEEQK